MDAPLRALGFAGSLRRESINRGLLEAARELAPADLDITIFDLAAIPLYDADLEAQGDPEGVVAFKSAIRDADGLLIASPEYNFGVTGVLKNAIDWASRPPGRSVLRGKPTATLGATPGRSGTAQSQTVLRQSLTVLGVPVLPRPLFVAEATRLFEAGELTDADTRARLERHLGAFADWIRRLR